MLDSQADKRHGGGRDNIIEGERSGKVEERRGSKRDTVGTLHIFSESPLSLSHEWHNLYRSMPQPISAVEVRNSKREGMGQEKSKAKLFC
uniref:Uncharacterized protein n=1 Tax=Nelumbo nucifera TaxID=4432 RepID=A0A823A002_NELNU|nr:TPA_asm: hypothetical protein HUJ06_018606 [Nelumbo nucifera]